jgi:hypothetical protein
MRKGLRFAESSGAKRLKMVNALISAIFVFGAVFVAKRNPILAGLLAVFPIKIITTAIATELQRNVLGSMLIGQVAVAGGLLILWLAIR